VKGSPAPTPLPVAVDAMGGDHAPGAIVDGALRAVAEGLAVVLVGDVDRLSAVPGIDELDVVHAPDVVPMDASPLQGLRDHPRSSIHTVLELVRSGQASAAVSCGNSGALVIEGVRVLRPVPGVERVALAVEIPVAEQGEPRGRVVLLDVGATVEPRAEHLVGFARLGRAFARGRGVGEPRLGLLSNGEEASKGTARTREALELARQAGLELHPVEPGPALGGAVDVLVTDGFTGNVVLKSIEATAEVARKLLARHLPADVAAEQPLSWRSYGGALLLGLSGVVVVGHGRAGPGAVLSAIRLAAASARQDQVGRLTSLLTD